MDVLEERTGDDVYGGMLAHLLHVHVHGPPKTGILWLQQFSDGEEKLSAFVIGEGLALVEQIHQID